MEQDRDSHPAIRIRRGQERFAAHAHRVILRRFDALPGPRLERALESFFALSEAERHHEWELTIHRFARRHHAVEATLRKHFQALCSDLVHTDRDDLIAGVGALPAEQQLLLGAYITMEYSFAAAAFFNPSMVLHPDQSELPDGAIRFILSFRAVGEGHISSLVFRTGLLLADGTTTFDPLSPYAALAEIGHDAIYHRSTILRKLAELQIDAPTCAWIGEALAPGFTRAEFAALDQRCCQEDPQRRRAFDTLRWLIDCNYTIAFDTDSDFSERVIFPVSDRERKGIEDVRFVRFVHDDGHSEYLATYSAYDGHQVLSQLIETTDFRTFHMRSLNGAAVRGKGMALFPRKVGGDYLMLGRQDGESITLMRSDHPHFWGVSQTLATPSRGWELIQLGNCGSPLETDAGWLVLTHGVGPMRRYSISALLLDRDDPGRVIGRLREPLLAPSDSEREGYVPNVLYSCGGITHGERLVLPYAMSDAASAIVLVDLPPLLDELLRAGP